MELHEKKFKQLIQTFGNDDQGEGIEKALKIFLEIKKLSKQSNEYEEALNDLVYFFGEDYKELKKKTKNQLYMYHQSKMVNEIYKYLEEK